MKELDSHKVNELNDLLRITVRGIPGEGGAHRRYDITGFDTEQNPAATAEDGYKSSFGRLIVLFQDGPIKEKGVNGISIEALLAIVEDQLACFQCGKYACRENAIALTKIQEAMLWLQKRTRDRLARGVEGRYLP